MVAMKWGRPTTPLVLFSQQRQTLLNWTRRRKPEQALGLCMPTSYWLAPAVSSLPTVGKWRSRFLRAESMDCWMNLVPPAYG